MNAPIRPEFIRLPKDGEHCPHTGLKRGTLRNLTLPTKANRGKPPVPARILRQRGKLRGVVLIPFDALMSHLALLPVSTEQPAATNCAPPRLTSTINKRTGHSAGLMQLRVR